MKNADFREKMTELYHVKPSQIKSLAEVERVRIRAKLSIEC